MRDETLNSVRNLIFSQLFAQAVALAGMLLIAWMYGAGVFGEYSYVWLIATTVGSFASLRYERALLVPGVGRSEILALVIILSAFVSLLVLVVGSAFRLDLTATVICALYVLAFSLAQLYAQVRIADGDFSDIAKGEVVFSVFQVVFQVALYYVFGVSPYSLMLASLIAKIVQFYSLYKGREIQWNSCLEIYKEGMEQYRFPLFSVPNSLLTIAPARIVFLVSGGLMSPEAFGIFTIAQRAVMMPVASIANSIRRVFVSLYSKSKSDGLELLQDSLPSLQLRVFLLTVLILFAGVLLNVCFTELAGYLEHADKFIAFANIFIPIAAVYLLFSWVDRVYEVENLQRVSLFLEALGGAAVVICFLVTLEAGGLWAGLLGFSASTVIYNICWIFATLKVSSLGQLYYGKDILILMGCFSLLLLAIFYFAVMVDTNDWII